MKKFTTIGLFVLSFIHLSPASFGGTSMTSDEINAAEFSDALPEGVSPLTAKLQVLLDRAGANPGVIDGVAGENVTRAIRGFEDQNFLISLNPAARFVAGENIVVIDPGKAGSGGGQPHCR